MKRVAILGCTGSVGTNALRLISERREHFDVVALTARASGELLRDQCHQFAPEVACLTHAERPDEWPAETAFRSGPDGILEALDATEPDLVLNAITGAAGLPASEWTLRHGKNLALANKESLVMAGPFLMDLARETGSTILPVDSEHCAIFQCLNGEDPRTIRRIFLTASGGPFRETPLGEFGRITPEQALRHPTWDMGPRITIGSATMMNKAFEVLEAHWLFDLAPEQIEVLVHPQSIVHSMVEFVDGSMLAQLGAPDMRVPILYCLAFPERVPFAFEPFDPVRFASLTFEPVDPERFPAVPLAYETLARGGTSGATLNAADEVLTGLFLSGSIPFPEITETVRRVVREHEPLPIDNLDRVLVADRVARARALTLAEAP